MFHLAPRGVDKAAAIAADAGRRGLDASSLVAVGDAPSDVALAGQVAAVLVVANGRSAIGDHAPPNVLLLDGAYGEGFAEAVSALLRGRR